MLVGSLELYYEVEEDIGSCLSYSHKTIANQNRAKATLLKVLDVMQESDLPKVKSDSLAYFDKLTSIYFCLSRGDYIEACSYTLDLLYEYTVQEAYDGLVFLLQKIERRESPCFGSVDSERAER